MMAAAPPLESPKTPLPLIVRILSGFAGMIVYLLGLVASLGAIVAAPVGMWLVRRRARRRNRPVTRIASLMGAVFASIALATVLWSRVLVAMPRPTLQELQSAAAQSPNRKPVKLPDWYTKAFPQAARYDSASRAMVQSPTFVRLSLILGCVFLGVFFGAVGGAFAWCGSTLISLAWSS